MVDYTWVVNLLREMEAFAAGSKCAGLTNSLAIACGALLSDTEGRAEIRAESRLWLEKVAGCPILLGPAAGEKIAESAQNVLQASALTPDYSPMS